MIFEYDTKLLLRYFENNNKNREALYNGREIIPES